VSAGGEYVAVIFSSVRSAADGEGYGAMAERMEALACEQPGYVGFESARNPDGTGITVSYWATETDAVAWKRVSEHLSAQNAGRDRWYDSYVVRVATVTREYSWERPNTLVHLALPDDWSAAQAAGEYRMSTRGITLEEEGFIHCSFDHQVLGVANRFYADLDELVVLRLDPARLGTEVVVEPPFPGSVEHFPHIYGPIPVDAVIATTPWRRSGHAWS
jgi:glutathione S-transferase